MLKTKEIVLNISIIHIILRTIHLPDSTPGSERKPTMEAFNEARKYTKYALSAIDYEDTRAVVENLRKALALMERF
ncbi:hypothetical protein Y032_0013g2067 [Ancylostoma ceylanicum]|nr:hypothetical protein Y032_0013g2067 [Ancylostoma ceylanicum]